MLLLNTVLFAVVAVRETMLRKGWHQIGIARQRLLLEVGRLQALAGRDPLVRIVHEHRVEELEAVLGEPRKLVLQVVVRLVFEREVLEKRELRESLFCLFK